MPDVVTAVAGKRRFPELMAIDAGIHGDILLPRQGFTLLHGAVANLTFHFGAQVFLVAEEYESR